MGEKVIRCEICEGLSPTFHYDFIIGKLYCISCWIEKQEEELLEKLADLEHQQWAHWTKYMLDNLTEKNIQRWRRQIETPYEELTEREKESDRAWARRVMNILGRKGIWKRSP